MDWKKEWNILALMIAVFLGLFYLPIESARFTGAVLESLHLAKWYAREHVILCLIPAFFIAGAVAVFISKESVMRYLGPKANKIIAYGVASVSGSVLAVCSCTVLPLFAGIYRMGAGLGPASAFLYAGPAVNVLAIILTARVLGVKLGIARAVGAVIFSIVIGLVMQFLFKDDETIKPVMQQSAGDGAVSRTLLQEAAFFGTLVLILVSATWGKPATDMGLWHLVFSLKWYLTGGFASLLGVMLVRWFGLAWYKAVLAGLPIVLFSVLFPEYPLLTFGAGVIGLSILTGTDRGETGEWFASSWGFAKQIMPLLFFGVLIAGALLGRPGHEGLIPSEWISGAVGGNSLLANFTASFIGAFMYFATLTEVPILQGLVGSGMGAGPALALLLAGPALSLPNMLVIRSIMGTKKTIVFVLLVVVMATFSGVVYGTFIA